MPQNTKHKHADLIIQWALGQPIEVKHTLSNFWSFDPDPLWCDDYEYRIKQQPKPDVVVYANMEESLDVSREFEYGSCLCGLFSNTRQSTDNIKVTYSGETGKLIQIEMIDQE